MAIELILFNVAVRAQDIEEFRRLARRLARTARKSGWSRIAKLSVNLSRDENRPMVIASPTSSFADEDITVAAHIGLRQNTVLRDSTCIH
jgi:hypothetical protein